MPPAAIAVRDDAQFVTFFLDQRLKITLWIIDDRRTGSTYDLGEPLDEPQPVLSGAHGRDDLGIRCCFEVETISGDDRVPRRRPGRRDGEGGSYPLSQRQRTVG